MHENYDGGTIELPGDTSVVLDPQELPLLQKKLGHDIVTTDGTTLLGADDKAGVAEIMAAVAYLKRHPELEHAPIRVCFTVDEEVAGGADHLDIDRFGARYAYTLDGSELGEIEAETFNASKVTVTIRGRSTHPGTAKGQLVNAIKLAADLVAGLPRDALSPETTEEREGFVHPTKISGGAEEACVEFIVRDHDAAKMSEHVALIRRLADEVREREPRASVEIDEEEQYRNMGEVIDQHPEVIEAAVEAVRRLGVEPVHTIIRGGTDGARLSHRGLPTPNLFTGGSEYHSRREWASVQDMAAAAAMIVELAQVWAERTGLAPISRGSIPWRRVVRPAPADHRRDDLEVAQLLGLDGERVAVEHDQVGEHAGEEPSAPALVAGEEGRRDTGRMQRLLDGQRLLRPPGRPLVDRPEHARGDAGDRVELLDGRVGAVREQCAGLQQ